MTDPQETDGQPEAPEAEVSPAPPQVPADPAEPPPADASAAAPPPADPPADPSVATPPPADPPPPIGAPRSERWAELGRTVLTGERFVLALALGTWVVDAALLAFTRGGATWKQWAQGMGAAAFTALSAALVVGATLGPLLVIALRPFVTRTADGWRALRRGDEATRQALLAALLAMPVVAALGGLATYPTTQAIVFDFARPDTMAAAMTVVVLGLSVAVGLAWRVTVRAMLRVVQWMTHVRGARWIVARAWRIPALYGCVVLAVVGALGWLLREEIGSLPWLEVVPLAGLGLGLVFAAYLPRAPGWMRRGALGLTVAVFVAGFVAAVTLKRESSRAQGIAFDRALSGRTGYAAWVLATDFDRDGQINLFGGGDCAPFDPRRHSGAPDLPNNGIDEDCDGSDLSPEALHLRPAPPIPPGRVPDRPTVIFVTIDALTALRLAAVGHQGTFMPRLDELATRSMLFTHAFSAGPSTRLSFPSILTSRWDSQLAWEYSARLPYSFSDKERTIQDAFDDAGYDTVAVIPEPYFDPGRWPSVTRGFQHVDTSALHSKYGKHDAPDVTDAALRALSEPRDKPLYMWVHYFDAHPPYGAPPGVTPPNHDDLTFYNEEIQYLDHELGRLIDALDHRPEPVYLFVTSDHATSFYPIPGVRHWNYGYDIYTSTLHVPLIVHGPGIRPGTNDHIVSTMDVAATFANMFHLNDKGRFEGTSLVPELFEHQSDPERLIFHEYDLPENMFRGHGDPLEFVSVRSDKWDLILNRKHGTYELYEWSTDYWEEHDLYEELGQSPEIAHLRSLLAAFLSRYGAQSHEAAGAPPAVHLHLGSTSFRAIQQ